MDSSPTSIAHKQGYLVKKGHIRRAWRTRWFVLSKNSLEYFKKRGDAMPRGRISLSGASLTCPVYDSSSPRPWVFVITTADGKDYSIQASDRETRDEWKLALEENIRRLDPSKRSINKRGVTLSRSLTGNDPSGGPSHSELVKQRDIIEAMQDSSAGIKLYQLRRGRIGKHVDKYFTGMAAVDWLITWYFCSTRAEAVLLCNSMLRNGLFHAIVEEDQKNGVVKSTIANDKQACNQFEDSEIARYIFVSFVTSQSVEKLLFDDSDIHQRVEDNCDGDSPDIVSSSSTDASPNFTQTRLQDSHSVEDISLMAIRPNNIIREGYLLKQGHVRKNWKIRKFVLKDDYLHYYRVEKVKSKPQGSIQLSGSIITTIEEDFQHSQPLSPGQQKRHSLPARLITQTNSTTNITKPHIFCIETQDHVKYFIQAESDEERSQWITDVSKQIDVAASSQKDTRTDANVT